MAGLQVVQAYGVSHRPGFGLLGSVPISLGTQPPFATQALISFGENRNYGTQGKNLSEQSTEQTNSIHIDGVALSPKSDPQDIGGKEMQFSAVCQ